MCEQEPNCFHSTFVSLDARDEFEKRDQGDERVIRDAICNHFKQDIVDGGNCSHGHLTAPIPSSQRPILNPDSFFLMTTSLFKT